MSTSSTPAAGRIKDGEYTRCTRDVHLRMGSDMVRWGIEVNGQEVIGHWDLHPMITLKGTWNGTRTFMMAWYIFDYE